MSDKIKLNIEDLETIFHSVLYDQHSPGYDDKSREDLINIMVSKVNDIAIFINKYTGSKIFNVTYDNNTGIEIEMEKEPLRNHLFRI